MPALNSYIHHLATLLVIYSQTHHSKADHDEDLKQAILGLIREFNRAQSEKRAPVWEPSADFRLFLTRTSAIKKLPTLFHEFVRQYAISQAGVGLHAYLLALQDSGRLPVTIKNYRSDIGQFLTFHSNKSLDAIVQKSEVIRFVEFEKNRGSSETTIRRKLVSVGQFCNWLSENGWISSPAWTSTTPTAFTDLLKNTQVVSSLIYTPFKHQEESETVEGTHGRLPVWTLPLQRVDVSRYLPNVGTISTSTAPLKKSIFSQIKLFSKNTPMLGYLNLAMGLIFLATTGFLGYRQFFSEAESPLAFPTSLTRPNRSLSFQGRLTNTDRTPITALTPMRFRLYDSGPSGGSGTLLWDSTSCNIDPDQDGIFSTTLGDSCGAEISSDVFSENSNVWLEVEVNSEILEPRQPIKSVAYALNSETLQGYPASASAVENTVLVMRNDGKVVFGNANPILEATGDSFTLTAKTMTLETSAGSNGNILINPDGTGQTLINSNTIIDGYLSAPGATLSATYAGGTALTLKAGPLATADILQWQNSGGGALGVIDESGNVGIGTSNPSYSLDVVGNIRSTQNSYFATTGGNVGIGTTNPNNFKLQVNGNVGAQTNNTSTLGSSSVRWANIYSVLGNYSGQITSSLATGTSPFAVTSTTVNTNLNADLLDGYSYNNLPYFDSSYLSGRSIADADNADNAGVTAYYAGSTNKPPGINHSLLTLSNSNAWSTQMAGDWRTNNWYVREQNSGTWGGWDLLWTSGNDGASSTLDADLLDGYNSSMVAGNSTVAVRNASGYIYANYFNTTANVTGTGASHFAIQTGSDNFIRWQTPADARTSLGLTAGGGGDIWVEKAGDTMTGSLTFSGVTTDITSVSNQHIAIMPNGTGNVGIGTTVPGASLEISNTLGPISAVQLGTIDGGFVKIFDDGGDASILLDGVNNSYILNGNVGIGTTNPLVKLSVYNTADSAISGVTTVASKVGVYGSSGAAAGYGVMGYNNSTAGVGILAQQDSTGYALYSLGGKNYFSGNVGIGSGTPGQALDVVGTGRFSTGIDANGTSSTITNLVLDGNTGTALNISGTSFTTDLNLQNGETIDNETDGRITLTGNSLTTGTTYFGSGATMYVDNTGVGNLLGLTLTNSGNPFVISGAATNAIIINNTGTTTDLSMQNGETIDNNTNNTINLGFGAANGILNLTSATEAFITSSVALNIDSATTNALNIGTGANAKTITLGNATGTTALNLNSGTGDITLTSTDIISLKPTSGVNYFNYASADNRAQFYNSGGTAYLAVGYWGSPRIESLSTNLQMNYNADSHVYFFGGAASGDNRNLYVYGYDTGATASKYGLFNIDTTGDFNIEAQSGEAIQLRTGGADSLTIASNGNVGIGSTGPTQKLDVNGRIRMATWTADGDTVAYRDTTTNSIALVTSDRRLKKNIVPLTGSLDIVNQLNTYKYNDLDEADGSKLRLGVMSQEILPLIPELTYAFTSEGSSETYYGVHYDKLTVLLLGAIKEQQAQIGNLAENSISLDEYGALTIVGSDESSYQVADAVTATPINDRFAAFTKTITAIIEAGLTRTKELVVTGQAQIADLSVGNLSINGQGLRDYIVSVIQENQATNSVIVEVSPTPAPVATATESAWLAEVFQREPTTDEPMVEDLTVTDLLTTQSIEATSVTTEGLSVTGQTQLDSLLVSENASVAGVMTVNELGATSARIDALEAGIAQLESVKATTAEFANATVSGTLYAQTIADLDKQIAQLLEEPTLLEVFTGALSEPQTDYTELYQAIGSITTTASQAAELDQSIGDLGLTDSDVILTADAGFIDRYFKINGIAYVADKLGVGNALAVGNKLEITDSYLSFSADPANPDSDPFFMIQPSGKGLLAMMGDLLLLDGSGQVTINGNLRVAGNITVEGSLLTNVLEPIEAGGTLSLNLGQTALGEEATLSGDLASPSARFEVLGFGGTPVATVSAQGQASFTGLSLGRDLLERPQVAGVATQSSELTQEATQTTGRAILPAGNRELTINNPNVRADSLIYLTPLGSTNNQVLYVKQVSAPDQETEAALATQSGVLAPTRSFTIGLDAPALTDISFTWWIVN